MTSTPSHPFQNPVASSPDLPQILLQALGDIDADTFAIEFILETLEPTEIHSVRASKRGFWVPNDLTGTPENSISGESISELCSRFAQEFLDHHFRNEVSCSISGTMTFTTHNTITISATKTVSVSKPIHWHGHYIHGEIA